MYATLPDFSADPPQKIATTQPGLDVQSAIPVPSAGTPARPSKFRLKTAQQCNTSKQAPREAAQRPRLSLEQVCNWSLDPQVTPYHLYVYGGLFWHQICHQGARLPPRICPERVLQDQLGLRALLCLLVHARLRFKGPQAIRPFPPAQTAGHTLTIRANSMLTKKQYAKQASSAPSVDKKTKRFIQ
ncbi:hypothetical protein ACHAWF_004180 [Thalassiosira exigua]